MNGSEAIARRTTADGVAITLDAAGYFWTRMNRVLGGRTADRSAAFEIADEICLYDFAELPALIRASKRGIARRHPRPAPKPRRIPNPRPRTVQEWRAHLDVCRKIRCPVCG